MAPATRRIPISLSPSRSSILNLPGESTLRRDFLRLQLANKERSEALRRQQLEQQQRENEEHKRQLLAERQKRIEEQKEQRRRLEEVRACPGPEGAPISRPHRFLGVQRCAGVPPLWDLGSPGSIHLNLQKRVRPECSYKQRTSLAWQGWPCDLCVT